MAATMERAYRAGVIGRAEMFKFKIMLIAHNAYKFQGRAQLYRNYLPQHIAIHVRKQYLAELNRKRKDERNAQSNAISIGKKKITAQRWKDAALVVLGGMFDEIPMIEEILSRAYDARD